MFQLQIRPPLSSSWAQNKRPRLPHIASLAFLVALFGTVARPADAAPVKYRFTGKTELMHESDAKSPLQIPALPQSFKGSFFYDASNSTAPLTEFTIQIAGQFVELPTPFVDADEQMLRLAAWRTYTFAELFPGSIGVGLTFIDSDSSKLAPDELPLNLQFVDFDRIEFTLDAGHDSCPMRPTEPCPTAQQAVLQHRGTVVTLAAIPEPGSMLLAAAGLAAIVFKQRRRIGN